ncbi:3-phenylpropionate/trans-cinnamate dioxygenase ferredoxin subunit [Lentzea atacamensis]|uniref:3-phenylpropionate/trans-cinnamate dioxygenase ferredoxin subunit n=1 Tax=Lentzea atacamensis TaxID=531938 RepID=A0A316IH65_9PSEU|nr:non-heme iron oxygenase ferredoxin subunit [Lentzea atacamensis]PWK86582.1 3-phenylpropionate/trans-cinnamate dioxygenase ferredoxin subunit [Lentzea atacamensis]RAS59961.1 3-phenylpropionate/trans-cinnamate dioxygenase ferredoxin subunit [Lentzea atacamensis]
MIRVCALSDLDDRKPFATEVDDVSIVLVRNGERVHALADECSHAAVSLSEGEVSRKGIECWLHGSCFDLETGKPSSLPATEPVDVYAVDIRDGDVFVDVTVTTN